MHFDEIEGNLAREGLSQVRGRAGKEYTYEQLTYGRKVRRPISRWEQEKRSNASGYYKRCVQNWTFEIGHFRTRRFDRAREILHSRVVRPYVNIVLCYQDSLLTIIFVYKVIYIIIYQI